jgi:dipeptidyl-peptidase 4
VAPPGVRPGQRYPVVDSLYPGPNVNRVARASTALRQLAETRRWIDLDRVDAFGHSGGGFATARAMLDFPEVYRAGVALSNSHDAPISIRANALRP